MGYREQGLGENDERLVYLGRVEKQGTEKRSLGDRHWGIVVN
jgi:hypothetical protein